MRSNINWKIVVSENQRASNACWTLIRWTKHPQVSERVKIKVQPSSNFTGTPWFPFHLQFITTFWANYNDLNVLPNPAIMVKNRGIIPLYGQTIRVSELVQVTQDTMVKSTLAYPPKAGHKKNFPRPFWRRGLRPETATCGCVGMSKTRCEFPPRLDRLEWIEWIEAIWG